MDESEKVLFWEQMDDTLRSVPQNEQVFIGGDFNGHVGRDRGMYDRAHGGHGFGVRNEGGEKILDFAVAFDLVIANTLYKKRDEHLITYRSGSNASQIDFFLTRRNDRISCKDCKVFPGENLNTQHRLTVLDMTLRNQIRKCKATVRPRIKWCSLKGQTIELFRDKMLGLEVEELDDVANTMWMQMSEAVKKVGKEILGESKGLNEVG
ncbi:hypothetical protein, partial [Bartonella sp. AC134YNZD]|uniref:hypothetical protein n=1 Tax=Bartonella sp. AC134YNZD TaxID=3243446 RepID=UPI0035CF6EA6